MHGGLQTVPADSQPATAVQPVCNPDCNRQDPENIKESDGVCRVAQDSEGTSGRETFAPEDERQIDLEEMVAEASDGDREEREAIQVIDGEFDPVRDRPAYLDRSNEK